MTTSQFALIQKEINLTNERISLVQKEIILSQKATENQIQSVHLELKKLADRLPKP